MNKGVISKIPSPNFLSENRRGQVTIFIIIAIILVAAFSLYFIFKDKISVLSEDPTSEPIINFVQECIDQTFEDSLIAVAKQGGYSGYNYIEKTNEEGITYYILEGKNYAPSKKRVETEISEYFERKFFLCTQHFTDFSDYQIKEGFLETSINIGDEKAKLRADYPLTITKGDKTSRVENFESEINVRLGVVYKAVNDFVFQHESTENLCLSCLNLAIEEDIFVDMKTSYEGEVVFTFRDDYSKLNKEPLEWVFANKY